MSVCYVTNLQGGPAQCPLVLAVQRKHRLGRVAAAVLDAVSLVQHNAAPGDLQKVQD